MVGYMEGFRSIEGDLLRPAYWQQASSRALLFASPSCPMLTVVVFTVFGKQTREWLMHATGLRAV